MFKVLVATKSLKLSLFSTWIGDHLKTTSTVNNLMLVYQTKQSLVNFISKNIDRWEQWKWNQKLIVIFIRNQKHKN